MGSTSIAIALAVSVFPECAGDACGSIPVGSDKRPNSSLGRRMASLVAISFARHSMFYA